MCQVCSQHFIDVNSFNTHNNLIKWVLLLPSFRRGGDQFTMRLSDLPKVTEMASGRLSGSRIQVLNHYAVRHVSGDGKIECR